MGNVSTLAVNNIFGPTFQGEGPSIGVPTMFLRLAGCNLACSWCDTPYTWDWKRFSKAEEITMMQVDEVWKVLKESPVKRLVISGGEPMLQQSSLSTLCSYLKANGWYIEIETAGTIEPQNLGLVDQWNISPKLESSGNGRGKRYKPDVLKRLNKAYNHCFKFVVTQKADFAEIDRMVNTLGLTNIMIMPEGITAEKLTDQHNLEMIAEETIKRGWNLTTRLHVLVHGNKRGV